jgi:muramoyltetrapeptide carboxypeptidase
VGGNSSNYFSGTDKERLTDFQEMLDDDEVKAVLCARGRIWDWKNNRTNQVQEIREATKMDNWVQRRKPCFMLIIYSNYKIATLHAPMAWRIQ